MELKEVGYQFLYEANEVFHFTHPETFEEIEAPKNLVDVNAIPYMDAGVKVRIKFFEDQPVIVYLASKSVTVTVKDIASMGESSGKG